MTKRMLIDATHPEETRVAVVSGNKLEDYDYETSVIKQLKGNIYLVKVTRVEPSLQAAFVDFGGNRHGFLPFPEIHPDYYRIPIADREAILAEERALAEAEAAKEAAEAGFLEEDDEEWAKEVEIELDGLTEDADGEESYVQVIPEASLSEVITSVEEAESEDDDDTPNPADNEGETTEVEKNIEVENLGGDVMDADEIRPGQRYRKYKIQEVIKRNQIMLIQISKEERGNKGAAVTSYISLPGRYCVLMPNSPRGGGVSRKVSNIKDRQRLRKILNSLEVPEGMSVILRTAGVSRTAGEIKRDLEYLLRLWDQIRELTLKSKAPALIYEEGSLVKRAIRDLYKRDIDEVHVAGKAAFNTAKDFMSTLIPSHVKKLKLYNDEKVPLFFRYKVEKQIEELYSTTVHLKSGGYIVINPTEALVSIDVNSGKATKGRHIEETALKTNIEAAEEIARQVRLRDQGGLVVIDFIDMEDPRNNRIVERKLKEAMSGDRARIQLGRISPFGLLELSRQRLNPSVVETSFEVCKHCEGRGVVRTTEAAAIVALRAIEEEALNQSPAEIRVRMPSEIVLYIFNNKRGMLYKIEEKYGTKVFLNADDNVLNPCYEIESIQPSKRSRGDRHRPVQTVDMSDFVIEEDTAGEDNLPSEDNGSNIEEVEDKDNQRPRRRGKRGGKNRGRHRKNSNNRRSKKDDGDNGASKESSEKNTDKKKDDASPDKKKSSSSGRRRRASKKKSEGSNNDNSSSDSSSEPASAAAAGGNKKGWWKRLTE